MKTRVTLAVILLAITASFAQGYMRIAQQQINASARRYVKFQDGSVVYIGKFIYELNGVIPKDKDFKNYMVILYAFKVLDVTDEGCRVAGLNYKMDDDGGHYEPDYDHDFFIEGFKGFSDRTYYNVCIVEPIGEYKYTTTLGSERSIPEYDYGEEATEVEYLNYCHHIGLARQATATTVITATNGDVINRQSPSLETVAALIVKAEQGTNGSANLYDYKSWQPIPPIQNLTNGSISAEAFVFALRETIAQLQHEAATANVIVPPKYGFSFEAERSLVRFAPYGLVPLSVQLGEVKMISEIIFAAHVKQLDCVQRLRVSDEDTIGPASDYIDGQSMNTELAILTPYQITFHASMPEITQLIAAFVTSPHRFIVKITNVQPELSRVTLQVEVVTLKGH